MGLDFKEIAEGARAFFYVGRNYLEPEKHIPGVAAIPYYVDTAFACELYMKAIIVFHNPNVTKQEFKKIKHRLDTLFELLPVEMQEEIKDKLSDQKIQEMQKHYISQYKKLLSTDAPDIVKNIAKKKNRKSCVIFWRNAKTTSYAF